VLIFGGNFIMSFSFHGIHHICVGVKDYDASVKFYKEVLGLKEAFSWGEGKGRGILIDTGYGSCIEMFAEKPDEYECQGSIRHLALRTSGIDEAIEKLRAAGFKVTIEPKDILLGGNMLVRIAFIVGPGGEQIELFENK